MSSATSKARRPSSSETTGLERSRTAVRKISTLHASGSVATVEGFANANLRIDRRSPGISANAENRHILPSVVERNVLLWLKEPQLAHPLGRNPAGGEIRHTSRCELQTHIGNIHLGRKNRQTHGANFRDRRIHKRQHDIEIVNHQVEDNVHVQRTRSKHAQPMDFEKHRPSDERKRCLHRGIETLEMTNLPNPAETLSQRHQFVSFRQRCSQRLLDKDVNTGLHQDPGNLQMMDRRHSHRSGLHFAMRAEQLLDRTKPTASKFAGHGVGLGRSASTTPTSRTASPCWASC